MIGIYKITSPSGKVYIGQTNDIDKRKSYYRNANCKNQNKLYHSLKKYGFDTHEFHVLCECELSQLTEKEEYYIRLFDSINTGLNLKDAGPHGKMSQEVREKISIGNKGKSRGLGRIVPDSVREKMSLSARGKQSPFKGRKHTDETKQLMSKKAIGKGGAIGHKHTQEFKDNLSRIKKGVKLSMEHKKSLSLALTGNKIWLGKKHSEESKLKMSEIKRGKKASEETKKKMSESAKARYIETISTAI